MDGDRSWRGLAEMRGDGGPVRPNLGTATATANCHPLHSIFVLLIALNTQITERREH